MQIFRKFDDLFTLCPSVTTLNLTEHGSVYFYECSQLSLQQTLLASKLFNLISE